MQGIHLPIPDAVELLDSMYADDTTLYVKGDEAILERVRLAPNTLCCAAGAKINWHKLVVFLTNPSATSQFSHM